jgi:hypothetical protein
MLIFGLIFGPIFVGACGPKNVVEAENERNVRWLSENPTGESIAALGRLADNDPRALGALEGRKQDLNVYVAAWAAVTRNASWGTTFLESALSDPARAELAASAMPRKDARLVPFIAELEGAVSRLAAGKRGSVLAGLLASVGPQAHAAVERRVLDAKTRGAMCDGIGLPEASGDAKSLLLAVPPEGRDHPSCVSTVLELASSEDVVINWMGTGAEPGLLGAMAKGTLACPRVAFVWKRALSDRAPDSALTVPLQRSISRCTTALDAVLGEQLTKTPRARTTIVNAIDPYGNELASLKDTCVALKSGAANAEPPIIRERANDAVTHGCRFAR